MYLHKGNEQCHERVLPRIYKLRLWVKADRVKCGYQEISAFFCFMLKLKLCGKVKATPSKLYIYWTSQKNWIQLDFHMVQILTSRETGDKFKVQVPPPTQETNMVYSPEWIHSFPCIPHCPMSMQKRFI